MKNILSQDNEYLEYFALIKSFQFDLFGPAVSTLSFGTYQNNLIKQWDNLKIKFWETLYNFTSLLGLMFVYNSFTFEQAADSWKALQMAPAKRSLRISAVLKCTQLSTKIHLALSSGRPDLPRQKVLIEMRPVLSLPFLRQQAVMADVLSQ